MEQDKTITKYTIHDCGFEVVLPEVKRGWMDDTWNGRGFANRCLPLVVANGFGWSIINPVDFTVYWNGGSSYKDLIITFDEPPSEEHSNSISCNFADGILTFDFGFLLRTSKGHNLYVKGPSNNQKDYIHPLEGVVETDWLPFPFTMNWRFTQANKIVRFKRGEPICTFFPVPRNYIESWKTEDANIRDNKDLFDRYVEWAHAREMHNHLAMNDPNFENTGQKHYIRGVFPSGDSTEEHQKVIRGCPFGGKK